VTAFSVKDERKFQKSPGPIFGLTTIYKLISPFVESQITPFQRFQFQASTFIRTSGRSLSTF